MKKQILFLIALFLPFLSWSGTSNSTQNSWSTEYKPKSLYGKNVVGIELLGRGLAYSLNYDRQINSQTSAGLGLTYYQMSVLGIGIDLAIIPLYGNYYFSGSNRHRGFVTGGATLVYVKAEVNTESLRSSVADDNTIYYSYAKADGTIVYPNVGVGYEFRTQGGFLARIAAYGQYLTQLYPWAGVTLGANF